MAPIEKGSLVLVTGANGYIGSHIADQLLQAGYKVRGTTRTEAKGKWLQDHFDNKYGKGKFELALVPDMAAKGGFDDAVKGCSGVAHVASNLSFSSNPNEVIPEVIAGVTHTLEAADKEPSIKRFVFTSSSTATTNPIPDKEFDIDENTWNQSAIDAAWAPPPYKADRGFDVYGASKTQAEQEIWKFQKERSPHFEINAVLPNANLGPIIDRKNQDASTGGWVGSIYKGGFEETMKMFPPQWFVNVQDTARLHVAALVDPDIKSERVFAFAEPYTWNLILKHLRELRPDHKFMDDLDDNSQDKSRVLRKGRAEEILKKNFGQSGFIGLHESLKQNLEGL